MRPEDYLAGLLAERDNASRAGRPAHVKEIDAEIKVTRAAIREAENAMHRPDVETR